jgi:xanthine dehydrogenase YagR molybdenum-binding subunit
MVMLMTSSGRKFMGEFVVESGKCSVSAAAHRTAFTGGMFYAAAKAAPGVLAVVTADNAGKLAKGDYNSAKLLGGPDIEHYHQAIAVVVAETFEQARAAAQLVQVDYTDTRGQFDLAAGKDTATTPKVDEINGQPETATGDFAGAFASAPVQLDQPTPRPTRRMR